MDRVILILFGLFVLSSMTVSFAYVPCSVNTEVAAAMACENARAQAWGRMQAHATSGRCWQITGDGGVGLNPANVYELRRTCYANGSAASLVKSAPSLRSRTTQVITYGATDDEKLCRAWTHRGNGAQWQNNNCVCPSRQTYSQESGCETPVEISNCLETDGASWNGSASQGSCNCPDDMTVGEDWRCTSPAPASEPVNVAAHGRGSASGTIRVASPWGCFWGGLWRTPGACAVTRGSGQ